MLFQDAIDGVEFKRGDKVKLAGRHPALTFEVLSVLAHRDGSFSYRVVELTQFGKPNEYRRSIVPASEATK